MDSHGPLWIINAHVGNYSWSFHAAHAGHSKYSLRCKSPRRHSLWLQEGDGHSLLGFLKWSIECRFDLKHLPFPAGWCPYWVNGSKGNQKTKSGKVWVSSHRLSSTEKRLPREGSQDDGTLNSAKSLSLTRFWAKAMRPFVLSWLRWLSCAATFWITLGIFRAR